MGDKIFVFSPELSKKLIALRFENEWLFKKRKQPWKDFHKILMENGFPKETTVKNVSKKWNYMYECYRIAKKTRNKNWKYYKLFDKYYGKVPILDKYESWNHDWRLKLVKCIQEVNKVCENFKDIWIAIEKGLRSQDLPEDCCIQDIKGLWHHIRMTFSRKYRIKLRKGKVDWPLFDAMVEYYEQADPEMLVKLATPGEHAVVREPKCSGNYLKGEASYDEYDFQWTKDITETFIQVRLQNDWLFRERKWAWNDLLEIMIKEFGFPKELTGREICRKWSSTFAEYQKAIATNNKSWVYYNLFEAYLGEGSLSFNPLRGWQEEWVSNLISARTDLNHLFKLTYRERNEAWREVEKRLRSVGLPIDHSLLELPEIWTHLEKTYRWKKKFSNKGILTEQWPYFEAMEQFEKVKSRHRVPIVIKEKEEPEYETCDTFEQDDDCDDDIKLFDLKQKMEREEKPKVEYLDANQCRACCGEAGCVNIYQQRDDQGLNLADKLKIIGDVEVDPTDNLPSRICAKCLQDLENAFKFRRKCQDADKELRDPLTTTQRVKIEIEPDRTDTDDYDKHFDDFQQAEEVKQKEVIFRKERRIPKNAEKELNNSPATTQRVKAEMPDHNSNHSKDDPDRTDIDDYDNHFDDFQPAEEVKQKKVRKERKIPKKKRRVAKARHELYKICDQCGKRTSDLKNHLDAHATGKFYSCEVCDKKFKTKGGLGTHKVIHSAPKKTCEVCGKVYHSLSSYRKHFVHHANERKFKCETCGKRFNTPDTLKLHNRIHTDERPFSCPLCGKTFRTAFCVTRHKRIVHKISKNQSQ